MPPGGRAASPGHSYAGPASELFVKKRENKMISRKKPKSQSITASLPCHKELCCKNPSQQHGILQVICHVSAENITVSRGLCLHQPLLSTAASTVARVERGVGPMCSRVWEGSSVHVQGLRRTEASGCMSSTCLEPQSPHLQSGSPLRPQVRKGVFNTRHSICFPDPL